MIKRQWGWFLVGWVLGVVNLKEERERVTMGGKNRGDWGCCRFVYYGYSGKSYGAFGGWGMVAGKVLNH